MPSGNIQRTLHNFVSTVVSVGGAETNAQRQGNNTRRTASNGSWIVSDNHLQTPSPASSQILHPRQSAAADLDFDFFDNTSNPVSQTISPRSVQLGHLQSTPFDIIENYIEAELGSTYTASLNGNNFDVTDLNSPTADQSSSIASAAGVPLQQLQQILRGASVNVPHRSPAGINNSLRNKIVYKLSCTYCKTPVCNRAMRAILLADTKIELYSTDIPPKAVVTMDEDRMTSGCNCRIRDTVCTGCGNVLGYHVSQPCDKCLEARNNGHFWMFCSEGVTPSERMHFDGNGPLYWASLPPMCDFVPASGFVATAGQAGNSSYDAFCR